MVRILRQGKGVRKFRQADIPDVFPDEPDLPFSAGGKGNTEADFRKMEQFFQCFTVFTDFPGNLGRCQGIEPVVVQRMAGNFMTPVLISNFRQDLTPYGKSVLIVPDKILQTGI